MIRYIGIEDLALNAVIELLDKNQEGKVYFRKLLDYGNEVKKYLLSQGVELILVFSNEDTDDFIHDYSDFFDIGTDTNGEDYLFLKNKAAQTEQINHHLRQKARSFLPHEWIQAYQRKEAVDKLLEVAA